MTTGGGLNMANPEHLAILKRGVKEWNAWREDQTDVSPDLSEADVGAVADDLVGDRRNECVVLGVIHDLS